MEDYLVKYQDAAGSTGPLDTSKDPVPADTDGAAGAVAPLDQGPGESKTTSMSQQAVTNYGVTIAALIPAPLYVAGMDVLAGQYRTFAGNRYRYLEDVEDVRTDPDQDPNALLDNAGREVANYERWEVQIATSLAQQNAVAVGADYRIPFSQLVYGPADGADLANSQIVVPVRTRATVLVSVVLKRVTIGGFYQIAVVVNSGTSAERVLSIALSPTADAGNNTSADAQLAMYAASTKSTFAAGDRVSCQLYAGQAAALRGQYNGQQCTLTFLQD